MCQKLKNYLIENKISAAALGRRIGVSRVTASRLVRGLRKPASDEVMNSIFNFTKGEVTANDFFGLPESAKPPRKESAQ